MISTNQFILNGLTQMEAMLGNPVFTWKGEQFRLVPNTLNDAEKASEAGFTENADFRMTVRLNQFTPNIYPALNDYIQYQGHKLLIKQVKKPAHNIYHVYVCEVATV